MEVPRVQALICLRNNPRTGACTLDHCRGSLGPPPDRNQEKETSSDLTPSSGPKHPTDPLESPVSLPESPPETAPALPPHQPIYALLPSSKPLGEFLCLL